jgi:hypothetical protein
MAIVQEVVVDFLCVNHNVGGVFVVGRVCPRVRQDHIHTVPAIIIPEVLTRKAPLPFLYLSVGNFSRKNFGDCDFLLTPPTPKKLGVPEKVPEGGGIASH